MSCPTCGCPGDICEPCARAAAAMKTVTGLAWEPIGPPVLPTLADVAAAFNRVPNLGAGDRVIEVANLRFADGVLSFDLSIPAALYPEFLDVADL